MSSHSQLEQVERPPTALEPARRKHAHEMRHRTLAKAVTLLSLFCRLAYFLVHTELLHGAKTVGFQPLNFFLELLLVQGISECKVLRLSSDEAQCTIQEVAGYLG